MRAEADLAMADVAAFQEELASFGEPWGADELGSLIGMCYNVIAGLAMECLQMNIGDAAYAGDGVVAMADAVDGTEALNEGEFHRLGGV